MVADTLGAADTLAAAGTFVVAGTLAAAGTLGMPDTLASTVAVAPTKEVGGVISFGAFGVGEAHRTRCRGSRRFRIRGCRCWSGHIHSHDCRSESAGIAPERPEAK